MKIEGRPKEDLEKKENKMNNNFVLISLEEKGTKKIAEAINNDTGRKILDYLAKKEATESELSEELKIPISTIHYNLKQLVDANLVVIDEFHYSKKGKEINHYKLANKYIIIAPKNADNRFMEALQKILPLTVITIVAGGVLTIFNLGSKMFNFAGKNTISAKTLVADSEVSSQVMMTGASRTMDAAPAAMDVSRPFLQSEMITWFFIGAVSIIVVYFIYELIKKKKQ
ncbi:MAG: ArsR/SmtB family transcription factor [Candidatus Woesearchaeota archaeon]